MLHYANGKRALYPELIQVTIVPHSSNHGKSAAVKAKEQAQAARANANSRDISIVVSELSLITILAIVAQSAPPPSRPNRRRMP